MIVNSRRVTQDFDMATVTLSKTATYQHLKPRPGSFYRELFVRGLNLRASRLVG